MVALEGRRVIQGAEADFINAHAGARALLKAGRARREELLHGDGAAVACILDADGDRATPSSTIRFRMRFTYWTETTRSSCSRVS